MIVRDGRNVVQDLGARRVFAPSLMRMIPGPGSTGDGAWTNGSMKVLFTRTRPAPRTYEEQLAHERKVRWDNIEAYRAGERARQARYRARKLAAG